MLKRAAQERVLILTTHFMDEADILGDRIAIMSQGKLVACGSSLFLKTRFGVGYNLILVRAAVVQGAKDNHHGGSSSSSGGGDAAVDMDVYIERIVLKHVPHARVVRSSRNEMELKLPIDAVPHFETMLGELEGAAGDLGIRSFGISMTSLEDVFINLADSGSTACHAKQGVENASSSAVDVVVAPPVALSGPVPLRLTILRTLISKRLTILRRDGKGFVFQVIIPIVMIYLALLILIVDWRVAGPQLTLDASMYDTETEILYSNAASNSDPKNRDIHDGVQERGPAERIPQNAIDGEETDILEFLGNDPNQPSLFVPMDIINAMQGPGFRSVSTKDVSSIMSEDIDINAAGIGGKSTTAATQGSVQLSQYLLETCNDHNAHARFAAFAFQDKITMVISNVSAALDAWQSSGALEALLEQQQAGTKQAMEVISELCEEDNVCSDEKAKARLCRDMPTCDERAMDPGALQACRARQQVCDILSDGKECADRANRLCGVLFEDKWEDIFEKATSVCLDNEGDLCTDNVRDQLCGDTGYMLDGSGRGRLRLLQEGQRQWQQRCEAKNLSEEDLQLCLGQEDLCSVLADDEACEANVADICDVLLEADWDDFLDTATELCAPGAAVGDICSDKDAQESLCGGNQPQCDKIRMDSKEFRLCRAKTKVCDVVSSPETCAVRKDALCEILFEGDLGSFFNRAAVFCDDDTDGDLCTDEVRNQLCDEQQACDEGALNPGDLNLCLSREKLCGILADDESCDARKPEVCNMLLSSGQNGVDWDDISGWIPIWELCDKVEDNLSNLCSDASTREQLCENNARAQICGNLDNDCVDVDSFRDARGYSCEGWSEHDCLDDLFIGETEYNTTEVKEILMNCPRACGFCAPDSASEMCSAQADVCAVLSDDSRDQHDCQTSLIELCRSNLPRRRHRRTAGGTTTAAAIFWTSPRVLQDPGGVDVLLTRDRVDLPFSRSPPLEEWAQGMRTWFKQHPETQLDNPLFVKWSNAMPISVGEGEFIISSIFTHAYEVGNSGLCFDDALISVTRAKHLERTRRHTSRRASVRARRVQDAHGIGDDDYDPGWLDDDDDWADDDWYTNDEWSDDEWSDDEWQDDEWQDDDDFWPYNYDDDDFNSAGELLGDLLGDSPLSSYDDFLWETAAPLVVNHTVAFRSMCLDFGEGMFRGRDAALLNDATFGVGNGLFDDEGLDADSTKQEFEFDVNVLHNSSAPHAMPTYLAELTRAQWKQMLGSNADYITRSHPLPLTEEENVELQIILSFFVSLFLLLPFSYIPASFGVFVVHERFVNSKHLQLLSGANVGMYWLATFLFDFGQYMVIVVGAMAMFFWFDCGPFVHNSEAVLVSLALMVTYGLSAIPQSYCYSFLFDSHSSAQVGIVAFNFVTGYVFVVVHAILSSIETTRDLAATLLVFFRAFPSYNVGEGFLQLTVNYYTVALLGESLTSFSYNEGIGRNIVLLLSECILYCAILMCIENGVYLQRSLITLLNGHFPALVSFFNSVIHTTYVRMPHLSSNQYSEVPNSNFIDEQSPDGSIELSIMGDVSNSSTAPLRSSSASISSGAADDDVAQERDRVAREGKNRIQVCIENLTKIYPATKDRVPTCAVDGLTLGIDAGECFGFLGANGAGKTTTMKILTGDEMPSSGSAHICQYDCTSERGQIRGHIGYCPQFDPLLDLMTARETLRMYGTLQGLARANLDDIVDGLMNRLGLSEHADRICGSYSGGNKRKLSLAIALIGNPDCVFLDEPSTGMDPVARRMMWDVIANESRHRSVILTTHLMEESEALCNRVGIMMSGKLACLGSLQHLKSKYGTGYHMEMKLSSEETSEIEAFLKDKFPGTKILEKHGCLLKFRLLRDTSLMPLSAVFRVLENSRAPFGIQEYSLSQTTLEQLFVSLSKDTSLSHRL
jgi:ABC-type multidrug transport system ATPase subunit